jgi:sarcosine oxidase subunit beta
VSLTLNYQAELPASADLVIVGGGVVGAATAFWAARAGLRAVVLERRPAICTLTTAAATGGYRLQHEDRDDWALVRESLELILNFAEATGQTDYDPGIVQRGYLWLTTEPAMATHQRALVAEQHAWGQTDVELLDGDEVRRRFPYVGAAVIQGRFRAGDGTFDQKTLAAGFAAASRAPIVINCGVTGFRVQGGQLAGVVTERGVVATGQAVLAAGPFSGPLAATAGLTLPLENVRRQKTILPVVPEVPPDAPMTLDEDNGTHWRPALSGAYLTGANKEYIVDPPLEEVPTDHALALRFLDPTSPFAAARITPFWAEVWARGAVNWSLHAGQYTMTPDGRPLIGPSELPGLWLNTGYGGHGVMQSPAGSRRLIDMITSGQITPDHPFRPDRTFAPGSVRPL